MRRITQLGTHIKLPDGRLATVVFNGLTGVGVKFGILYPDPVEFEGTNGDLFSKSNKSAEWEARWQPDAMLRSPDMTKRLGLECVCEEKEVEILEE